MYFFFPLYHYSDYVFPISIFNLRFQSFDDVFFVLCVDLGSMNFYLLYRGLYSL